MKKEEILALIGKGIVEINGITCRFDVSKEDRQFINITVPAINPYTPDRKLGRVFLSEANEAWWADLEEALAITHKKMRMQAEIAKREPMELDFISTTSKGKFYGCAENNREYQTVRYEQHFEVIVAQKQPERFGELVTLNAPIKIAGKVYRPMWSWWMGTSYYKYQTGEAI